MNKILKEAEEWREAADNLLEDSKLLQALNEFGDSKVTGSHKYNLLMSPDIDIYLVSPEPTKELAKNVVDYFIDEGWWNGVDYADWVNFRYPKYDWLPKAFYVRLRTSTDKARWKVDIWLVTPEQFNEFQKKEIAADISDAQRLTILKLKDARNNQLIDADGSAIYEAVISRGVKTVDEFRKESKQP